MGYLGMTKKARQLKAKSLVDEKDRSKQYVSLSFSLIYETDVTIYRSEADGFIFDYDSEEYFDEMSYLEAEVIFSGRPDIKHSYAYYRDYDIELDKVYVYWVSTKLSGDKITGPVAVKTRNADIWWHYDRIMSHMYEIENKYENACVMQFGESVEHRAISGIIVGNRNNIIACIGAIHAGESGPEISLSVLENILETEPELLQSVGIAVLPVVNADMREAMAEGIPWYLRTNKNGVDLNRNFDMDWEQVSEDYGLCTADPNSVTYRGVYAQSEPETKATVKFVKQVNPGIILAYHSLSGIAGDRMICSEYAKTDLQYGERFEKLARVYSDAFRIAADMKPREEKILELSGMAGSFPAWCYKNGFLGTDLELAMGENLDCFGVCRDDKVTPEILDYCIKLHTAGTIALMKHLSVYNETEKINE